MAKQKASPETEKQKLEGCVLRYKRYVENFIVMKNKFQLLNKRIVIAAWCYSMPGFNGIFF